MPESCVKVLRVLSNSYDYGCNQAKIAAETGLSVRSVKYAVKRLLLLKLISELVVMADTRRKLYFAEVKNGA